MPNVRATRRTSVVAPVEKPLFAGAIHPVNGAIFQDHIPFVSVPYRRRPPIARCAPWAGRLDYFAGHAFRRYAPGIAVAEQDTRGERRTKVAERQSQSCMRGIFGNPGFEGALANAVGIR